MFPFTWAANRAPDATVPSADCLTARGRLRGLLLLRVAWVDLSEVFVKLRSLLVLALAGAFGIPLSGSAAEPLRLQDAVARALVSHPSLAAETAQLRAIRAKADREALATPYILGGELENLIGTGALSGFKSAETTLRIGRVLELGGKRAARQALGTAEVDQQQNQAEATRIAVAPAATNTDE